MELSLDSPVQYVPRVGPRMAGLLRKLGIETVYDLLTYVPFRYNDYSIVSKIAGVQAGETVTLVGTLASLKTFTTRNGKRIVTGRLTDETGSIDLTWFNQTFLMNVLHEGDTLSISGKADWFGPKITVASPVYEVLRESGEQHTSLHTGRLVPVYPETEGLSSKWLRGRIAYVLEHALPLVHERLPEEIRTREGLMPVTDAITTIHFPASLDDAARARERLSFDEIFTLMIRSYIQKHAWKTTLRADPLPLDHDGLSQFISSVPFTLTRDQHAAVADIVADIGQSVPMNRLLLGDVGAGKTVVAAAAMFSAARNGKSSALLAPTQILAEQHAQTLRTILEKPHGIPVHLILGGQKGSVPVATPGKPAVYVGTHALLTKAETLPQFGVIVIDEQQRFGVSQRAKLREQSEKGNVPHQLTMTATPIPRTIAQTVFGNLDLSVIHEMPKGRKPVKTWVVPNEKRKSAYAWIEKTLTETHSQAFVICPLIEASETLTAVRAATTEFERLKAIFPKLRLGLVHGRQKAEEKTKILKGMHDGAIDILVATPVVEVGIDIPEATVMVIEAAERFGLSQLHQLRGRVGRRDKEAYCLLFTENGSPETQTRLKALETTHSGPELAELDLTLRGPGELFGTRQHGMPGFAVASLADQKLLARVGASVETLTAADPGLVHFPHLREMAETSKIEAIQS